MQKLPIQEINQFATRMKELSSVNTDSKRTVYTIQVEPEKGYWYAHVSPAIFKELMHMFERVEISFTDIAAHIKATYGQFVVKVCFLRDDLSAEGWSTNKPTEQLYQEWLEKGGWANV